MPALREIALTVEERATNQFFWVLLEAFANDAAEAIHYGRLQTAATPQPTYSSALAMGANALRKLVDPDPVLPTGA